jgi:hypothetical protein
VLVVLHYGQLVILSFRVTVAVTKINDFDNNDNLVYTIKLYINRAPGPFKANEQLPVKVVAWKK